ncbi:MAG: hypothetical protein ACI9S8_002551 [Chlamydiales bacterium]|jgi:hypothetical protein
MYKLQRFISLVVLLLTSTGCIKIQTVSKGEEFPLMYEAPPTSLLILPPINESTAAEAKDYYATTIQEPLVVFGYYVLPYQLSSEVLKKEGFFDTELIRDAPLGKFKEFFGADAVLFTTIKKWDVAYLILASNLTVSIDCELKSTRTNASLWKYNGTVIVDLSGNDSQGGVAGLIAKAIASAINTALADYVPYARIANYRAMSSLPLGKYHARHFLDQGDLIIKQN